MENELHLIVVWENARYKEKEILDDIASNLKIREIYEITWSKDKIANNFSRFYGEKLPSKSTKIKECGGGNFLLIIVEDENPKYDYIETSKGHEKVNYTLMALKEKYRILTNQGCKVHSTNSIKETNHDSTLMLGLNYEDLKKSLPDKFDGNIKKIKRDITGAYGWKSFEELFYTLSATVNYVVLRGLEEFKTYKGRPSEDIDILTNEYNNFCLIVNGEKRENKTRPHFLTKIANEYIYLDVWNTKNDYYDFEWSNDILESRIFNNIFYTPDRKNAFFEYVYHCLIHKKIITEKNLSIAKKLFDDYFGPNNQNNISQEPFAYYFDLLQKFMSENSYTYSTPKDKTVFLNKELINIKKIKKSLYSLNLFENIELTRINQPCGGGYIYFNAMHNGKKLFIKYGGISESARNEFKMSEKLYKLNNKNFVKPYFYRIDKDVKFIAMEFLEGENLASLLKKGIDGSIKEDIKNQLEEIAKTLIKAKIVHRDVHLDNLFYTKDGLVKLIDEQYSVNFEKYKEDKYLKKHPKIIKHLGLEYAPCKYVWDDMYSLKKVLEKLGCKSEFINKNVGKYRIKFKKSLKLFGFEKNENHIVFTFFGIKIKARK